MKVNKRTKWKCFLNFGIFLEYFTLIQGCRTQSICSLVALSFKTPRCHLSFSKQTHIPNRPINRYRTWISLCGSHRFSPHLYRFRTWLRSRMSLSLLGGGMMRTDARNVRERVYHELLLHVRPAARHLIGYPLTNRIPSTPFAWWMLLLRGIYIYII